MVQIQNDYKGIKCLQGLQYMKPKLMQSYTKWFLPQTADGIGNI